jgi:hypothetical protein
MPSTKVEDAGLQTAPVGRLVALKAIGESGSLAYIGKYRVIPACTVLFPIGAKTGGRFGAGDGVVGAGDGLVGIGDGVGDPGDGLVGTGDGVVGAFVTVIVIVSDLSVLLTVTLIWLPGAVDVVETVPLNAHPICAARRQPKTISTLRILFISSDIFTWITLDPCNNAESGKHFANRSRQFAAWDNPPARTG